MERGQRQIEVSPRFLRDGETRSFGTTRCLTIATMNVWFENHFQEKRWAALFGLMEQADADVIAFQEVTAAFIDQLSKQAWTAGYQWVDDGGPAIGHYGVGILSRVPLARAWFVELPSQMGRTLLSVELRVGDETFTVATTHLESLGKNADYRAQQLETIGELLRDARHGLLCGDLNFCASWQNENDGLDMRYEDIWSVLRPNEEGFTLDPSSNRMLKKGSMPSVRFDRMLLFSEGSLWRPKHIDILGTESLPGFPSVFPSDHYGLVATIEARGVTPRE